MVEIEDLLAIGNLTAAASHISAYSPTTSIDQNYKDYFQLYYTYILDGTLAGTQLSELNTLALKCPFIDGPVVFKARSLYNLTTKNVVHYNDAYCIIAGGERVASNINRGLEKAVHYQLYPNPAKDQLNIIGSVEKETLEFIVKDVSGKIILRESLNIVNYRSNLKLDLLNGIYLVTLINKHGLQTTKKMVIAK